MADEYGDEGSFSDYMPGGSQYIPEGGGMYKSSGGDWQRIYAPGGGSPSGGYLYDANAIYGPSAGGGSSYTDKVRADANREAEGQFAQMNSWGTPSGGGGGFGAQPTGRSGGGGFVQQPFQRIGLGTPERTLYDRYSSMLRNPEQMTQDPAYQFLFNQGKQALDRSLAAKRMLYSGKALNDTMAFGAGTAANYFKSMIPNYQAGAHEELQRFMGPAGLLPGYAGVNNRASEAEGSAAAARELMPLYASSVGGGGGGGYGGGSSGYTPPPAIGYGGVGSSYSAPRLDPRTLATMGGGDNEDILTALERVGYGG